MWVGLRAPKSQGKGGLYSGGKAVGSSGAESETGRVGKAPDGVPGPGYRMQLVAGEGRLETRGAREGGWSGRQEGGSLCLPLSLSPFQLPFTMSSLSNTPCPPQEPPGCCPRSSPSLHIAQPPSLIVSLSSQIGSPLRLQACLAAVESPVPGPSTCT